jgi:hypothetical protein
MTQGVLPNRLQNPTLLKIMIVPEMNRTTYSVYYTISLTRTSGAICHSTNLSCPVCGDASKSAKSFCA